MIPSKTSNMKSVKQNKLVSYIFEKAYQYFNNKGSIAPNACRIIV